MYTGFEGSNFCLLKVKVSNCKMDPKKLIKSQKAKTRNSRQLDNVHLFVGQRQWRLSDDFSDSGLGPTNLTSISKINSGK